MAKKHRYEKAEKPKKKKGQKQKQKQKQSVHVHIDQSRRTISSARAASSRQYGYQQPYIIYQQAPQQQLPPQQPIFNIQWPASGPYNSYQTPLLSLGEPGNLPRLGEPGNLPRAGAGPAGEPREIANQEIVEPVAAVNNPAAEEDDDEQFYDAIAPAAAHPDIFETVVNPMGLRNPPPIDFSTTLPALTRLPGSRRPSIGIQTETRSIYENRGFADVLEEESPRAMEVESFARAPAVEAQPISTPAPMKKSDGPTPFRMTPEVLAATRRNLKAPSVGRKASNPFDQSTEARRKMYRNWNDAERAGNTKLLISYLKKAEADGEPFELKGKYTEMKDFQQFIRK
eukprot:gene27309-32986_t